MNNLMQNLVSAAMNNPQVKNSPLAQEGLGAIFSNDNKKGEQIANNILASYGLTKEQGIEKAKEFFHI